MSIIFNAPLSGKVVELAEVPDPVFSGEIVGPGVAIIPSDESGCTVTSPVAGKIIKIHPHAFVALTENGVGCLVHLGLDTVSLEGKGFTLHQENKATVAQGDDMVTWNPKKIAEGGHNPIVPVIAMERGKDDIKLLVELGTQVQQGEPLMEVK